MVQNLNTILYSNIIQYDDMGYPLRLIIDKKGEQQWLDDVEREGDKVLQWSSNVKEPKKGDR